jgi:hypothetical protein
MSLNVVIDWQIMIAHSTDEDVLLNEIDRFAFFTAPEMTFKIEFFAVCETGTLERHSYRPPRLRLWAIAC